MKTSALFGLALTVLLISACSPGSEKVDPNLKCAAFINAANTLSVKGEIETNDTFDRQSLFSGMLYLNTYAIPNGLSEAEAFEQLGVQRDALMQTESNRAIKNKAEACIRKTPQQ